MHTLTDEQIDALEGRTPDVMVKKMTPLECLQYLLARPFPKKDVQKAHEYVFFRGMIESVVETMKLPVIDERPPQEIPHD